MSKLDVLGKTRLNPYVMLLLLAGAVAVAYVVLGISLLRQGPNEDALTAELESGVAVLAAADDVRQDLEVLPDRLVEARQELWVAQEAFPSELNSNNIVQMVLELAGESGVSVRSVETIPPVAESGEESGTETALTYDVEVEGDFGQLTAFLEALEEGETSTIRVSTFSLEEADGRYLMDLELIAYARSTALETAAPEQGSADGGAVIPVAPSPAPSPAGSPEQGGAADEGAEATGDVEETARESEWR
jgi:hypothetical protein